MGREMHYVWSASGTTVLPWINGDLALQRSGVKTKGSSHKRRDLHEVLRLVEGGTTWSLRPSVKYMRNVRIAGERIWR
jgi:hypothetical protein